MITDHDFADDIVIFAETLEALVVFLDTLSIESKPLGLKVSWIKTKIQKFVAFLDENIDLPPPFLYRENLSPILIFTISLKKANFSLE